MRVRFPLPLDITWLIDGCRDVILFVDTLDDVDIDAPRKLRKDPVQFMRTTTLTQSRPPRLSGQAGTGTKRAKAGY
jgi:hypothetical protein